MYGSVITSWKRPRTDTRSARQLLRKICSSTMGKKRASDCIQKIRWQIIRNLFRDYLEACDALKRESDAAGADSVSASTATAYSNSAAVFPDAVLLQSVREILPKIVPAKIGSKGQILEWNEEFEESEPHHRHLSASVRVPSGTGNHEPDRRSFTAR